MKTLVIGGLAATLLAGTAMAQDTTAPATTMQPDTTMPAPDVSTPPPPGAMAPPPPPPMDSSAPAPSTAATAATSSTTSTGVSWSGLYAGIHGGYGIDNDRPVQNAGANANNVNGIVTRVRPGELRVNRHGPFGGGQVGYNMQRGNIIYGAEADFSYADLGGLKDYRNPIGTAASVIGRRTRVSEDTDWLGTVRARAGYALGSGMIYGTGGYAYGKVKGYASFYGNDGSLNYYGRHSYIAQGWTAGGGFEFKPFGYMDGPMSKVSLRGELLYYDLGKSHISAFSQAATSTGYYTLTTTTRGFNGRVGINYAF